MMYRSVSVIGICVGLAASSPAGAIPASQAKCNIGGGAGQTISSSAVFVPLSNLRVSVNNGSSARRTVVQLSADICVEAIAEVRIAYSVDGGAPGNFGPTNFANHQEFCETRTTMAVIPVPAGVHTITPYWRVSGAPGKTANFIQGCLTAESFSR